MALDSGIAKMGVFAFIVLLVFGGLLSLTPTELVSTAKTPPNTAESIPESWNGVNLLGYNFSETWNKTLAWGTIGTSTFDIGGRNLRFYEDWNFGNPQLGLGHRYGFLLLWIELMNWFYPNGQQIPDAANYYQADLVYSWENFGKNEHKVLCLGQGAGSTYFYVTAILSFNRTSYDTPLEAWQNNDLNILFGINPENSNVGMDIWALVAALLTFNTVEVFGTSESYAVILNGIMAAMIFAPIVIFIAAIIFELFPDWL